MGEESVAYEKSCMTCRNCGRAVTVSDRFCPWCGTPHPTSREGEDPDPEDSGASPAPASGAGESTADELVALRATINSMTAELGRLSLRLDALERGRSVPSAPRERQPAVAPVPQPAGLHSDSISSVATPADRVASREDLDSLRRGRPEQEGNEPSTDAGHSDRGDGLPGLPSADFANWNWEWLIGGNWLARIGVVALILGVAFFISLAIDRGWLGEVERVLLGVAGGLAFVGAGEYWRKRYAVWAQTVVGGGLAILYLSVYGAFALYELIPPLAALAAFSLITIAGAVLALRLEGVAIAVIAILSGFATPLLLQERLPDQRLLLAYVLVLDVGVLALASFRNWRWFTLLALAGSLVLFQFWREELDPSTGLAQAGISAIFLIFVAATVVFNLVRKQAGRNFDLALITVNAGAYYGISYSLISDVYAPWMGAFTVGVAALYVLLAIGCRLRGEEQLNLSVFSAGLATVFAILAVPIQLGGPWVSVAWGIEGLVLVGMSFPVRMRDLRWFGYVMFVVSAVWLLVLDTPEALSRDLTPFFNEYLISYAGAIILPAVAGWLLHLRRDDLESSELVAIPVFALRSAIFAAAMIPVQLDGVWISIAWAAETVFFLWMSSVLRMQEMRWFAYGLLAATVVRLAAWDTLDINPETFRPFINWRFLAFAAGIAALYWAAWFTHRGKRELPLFLTDIERKAALPALLGLASLATLWLLSAEIIATANSGLLDLSEDVRENVWSLGLSLLWAVYAAVLIALGVGRRWRWVRLAGLALLAAPVIKLFAFDSLLLEQEYRVIAFLALGLLLVAGGLLYQRYSRVVRGFLFE